MLLLYFFFFKQEFIHIRNQITIQNELERHKPPAYINDALIHYEIDLLEKERGNSGCNRIIKMIPGYTTNNNTETQRKRGGWWRGEREREKFGVVTA